MIKMDGAMTTLREGKKGKEYKFTYDHSFWSNNSRDSHFADQAYVFECVGQPIVKKAFEGYNCCLFAYGQTGSGKSYTMMGNRGTNDRGVIPRFSEQLWETIQQDTKVTYQVEVSYFEIYSEQIYDLLIPPQRGQKSKLKVREHPVMGPYVENLSSVPALSVNDIEGYIALGSKYRATASTNMNATSSRSHAVFIVNLTMTEDIDGEEAVRVSKINLVDLAGSERSNAAGTTGQRLKEGSAINKSLHTLGKVISILATKGSKAKKVFVPYRDSVLTWILKESLGGNAKTGMLATVSPSSENYDETLSTLRYAHQARSIVNDAKVNEDPNIALIRDLRAEVDAMRAQYGDSKGAASMAQVTELKDKLASSERLMAAINRTWEQKLRQSEQMREENARLMKEQGVGSGKVENRLPNLVNLNEDPQLSEMLIHILKVGESMLGKDDACEIPLKGTFVLAEHAVFSVSEAHQVTLTNIEEAVTYVNGEPITANETIRLRHGDRVIVGNNHYFRVNVPKEVARRRSEEGTDFANIKDYRFAKEELERIQRDKVAAELQIEHDAKTEIIEQELETAKFEAQRQIEQQRAEYEDRLNAIEELKRETEVQRDLAREQVEQAVVEAQEEERVRALAEIEAQHDAIREERAAMEHRMAEEKEVARMQMEEETEAKNKIIGDLEGEKSKIESDLASLRASHDARRASRPNLQLLTGSSALGMQSDGKKQEWLHTSVLVKEANDLSQRLNQNTIFRRADNFLEDGEPRIRLHNTKLNVATTWSLDKLERQLEEVAEAFGNLGEDEQLGEDLFYDASDDWEEDTFVDVPDSPLDALRARPASFGGNIDSAKFSGVHRALKAEARSRRGLSSVSEGGGFGAGIAITSEPSVPLLCREYIKNSAKVLASRGGKVRTSADEIVECVSALRSSTDAIHLEATEPGVPFDAEDAVPLNERGAVRNASLSVALSLELLCNTIRALSHNGGGNAVEDIIETLSEAAGTTAEHCASLLAGVEKGKPDTVDEHYDAILDGINAISMAAGELAIATAAGEEDEDDPRFHTGDHDQEEFADDEAEVAYTSSSRMVDLNMSIDSHMPGIDQSILEAFERGTHMHVERSLDNLTQDMEEAAMGTLDLVQDLGPRANISAPCLEASAEVANTARNVFSCATDLQVALTEHAAEFGTFAKQTFYRKTFARAKGIINEVREVADAVSSLARTCTGAADGSEEIEDVMAHTSAIRSSVARLISAAETKLDADTTEHQQLSGTLRDSCSEVIRATKQLTQACQIFSSSQPSRGAHGGGAPRGSSRIQGRSFSSPQTRRKEMAQFGMATPVRGSGLGGGAGGAGTAPMSEVRRRTMLLEQQADVFRLERQLQEAQKGVRNLHQDDYADNEGTTDI